MFGVCQTTRPLASCHNSDVVFVLCVNCRATCSALEFGNLPLNAPGDAKGVSAYQPGALPGRCPRNKCEENHSRAQTARFIGPPPRATRVPRPRWSISHVTFIEFNMVLAQQLAILLLEGF